MAIESVPQNCGNLKFNIVRGEICVPLNTLCFYFWIHSLPGTSAGYGLADDQTLLCGGQRQKWNAAAA